MGMTTSERERLLCYAAGIMGSRLSNPTNVWPPKSLIKSSIKAAQEMIETVYDDEKLAEIFSNETK